MKTHEEKRQYPRCDYSSPILLHRLDRQDLNYYAEMKDYSRGGMSLMTNEKLVVGHLVYLEMKNYNEHAAGPEKCRSYHGSVRWLTHFPSSDGNVKDLYKYGIEYNLPACYEC